MHQTTVTYTNMLVSKNTKVCVSPNAKPKICFTPNANPQRESVEYRLRWVPNAKFSHWQCTFHYFCVDFICVWWPKHTQFPVEYGFEGNYLIYNMVYERYKLNSNFRKCYFLKHFSHSSFEHAYLHYLCIHFNQLLVTSMLRKGCLRFLIRVLIFIL